MCDVRSPAFNSVHLLLSDVDEMVNGEQDNGSHNGTNEACAFIGTPTQRLPKVSRDECAVDTQYGGADEAARVRGSAALPTFPPENIGVKAIACGQAICVAG